MRFRAITLLFIKRLTSRCLVIELKIGILEGIIEFNRIHSEGKIIIPKEYQIKYTLNYYFKRYRIIIKKSSRYELKSGFKQLTIK